MLYYQKDKSMSIGGCGWGFYREVPVTDARKTGPFGAGGEAEPITVDLTRIDIRRGTLYLPRRFYGALPEGELQAQDAAAGKTIPVSFQPPRQLEGLGPFYEEHDLRPNDAVSLNVSNGLQLTPIRRERRQSAPSTPAEPREVPAPARQSSPATEGKGGWQDVLHDPAPRPHPGGYSKPEAAPRPAAPPVPRADEATLVEPPFDAGSGEARHVAPRDLSRLGLGREKSVTSERTGSVDAEPVAGRRPDRSDLERLRPEYLVQQHERMRRERSVTGKAGQFGSENRQEEPSDGFLVREKPTRERPSAASEARPLAPAGGESQQGLFESTAIEEAGARQEPRSEQQRTNRQTAEKPVENPAEKPIEKPADRPIEQQAARPRGSEQAAKPAVAAKSSPRRQAEPPAEKEEREPVMVGAGSEGAAFGQISRYLQDPGTPAIVRAEGVAEALKLPVDTAKKGLAEAAQASEGAITAIRPDVYLVKRSR